MIGWQAPRRYNHPPPRARCYCQVVRSIEQLHHQPEPGNDCHWVSQRDAVLPMIRVESTKLTLDTSHLPLNHSSWYQCQQRHRHFLQRLSFDRFLLEVSLSLATHMSTFTGCSLISARPDLGFHLFVQVRAQIQVWCANARGRNSYWNLCPHRALRPHRCFLLYSLGCSVRHHQCVLASNVSL